MALLDRLSKPVQSLGGIFFGGKAALTDSDPLAAFGGTAQETREMYDAIAARVGEARAAAKESGEAFSIEHYRQACVAFGENNPEGQRMVAEGKWNPASYADLSGQDLHGIRLTNPKLIKPEHKLSPAVRADFDQFTRIEADYDSFNRDGDGQINVSPVSQFYDSVKFDSEKFDKVNGGKKTDLRNSIVDPSTSFNAEIAKVGGEGLTINNMCKGDTFTFGASDYKKIKMTHINGGEVIFGDGSGDICRVEGLEIEGKKATITMRENAIVSNVTTSAGFSMVDITMAKGATLSGDLTKATISMASEFEQGGTFKDVQFGPNVKNLNFSGLTLNNVTIDGVPIQQPSDLTRFDIAYDETTYASVNPEMAAQYKQSQLLSQVAELGRTAFGIEPRSPNVTATSPSGPASSPTIAPSTAYVEPLAAHNKEDSNTAVQTASAVSTAVKATAPENDITAMRALALAERITGGETVTSKDIMAFNPAKDTVARLQPEQPMSLPSRQGQA
ncbi:MAG: hypothetical protein K2X09_03585 [Rickettsiales bacterium]|nr:hypothetical protein [Rickettsiales bacterium]